MRTLDRVFYFVITHELFALVLLWLGSLINVHVYLGGFFICFSVYCLNRFEGICAIFILENLYDGLNSGLPFGVTACIIASTTLLFNAMVFKNMFLCHVRLYSFLLNFVFHGIYVSVCLIKHGIKLSALLNYIPSMLITSGVIALISVNWLKMQQKYFL